MFHTWVRRKSFEVFWGVVVLGLEELLVSVERLSDSFVKGRAAAGCERCLNPKP